MEEKWTFGKHEARFEPPDILWIAYRGETNLEDVRWAVSLFRQTAEKAGPFFFVGDVKDSSIHADARKHLAHEAKTEWFRAAVYVGAGLPQKAMSKAINLAFMVLGKPGIPMVFVDRADQARAWIERRRAQPGRDRKAS